MLWTSYGYFSNSAEKLFILLPEWRVFLQLLQQWTTIFHNNSLQKHKYILHSRPKCSAETVNKIQSARTKSNTENLLKTPCLGVAERHSRKVNYGFITNEFEHLNRDFYILHIFKCER